MTDKSWIVEQLTVLAESFGTAISTTRLRIYAEQLCDLDQAALTHSIGRVIRECKFFPTIAELRELAGANEKQHTELEAESAWQLVERDLARSGRNATPHLDARTEYAIRAAGGRPGINAAYSASVTDEAFCKKRFLEAFKNFDSAEDLGLHQLPANVSAQLRDISAKRALNAVPENAEKPAPFRKMPAKPMLSPLSDDELSARRAQLARQAAELRDRAAASGVTSREARG